MQENELIERSRNGDKEAFSSLVLMHQSNIYKLCLRISKDENIAKDLAQETFLKAYKNLSSFKMKSKFSTWLYRIAYNHSLNYLKKKNHLKEQEFKEYLREKKEENEDVDWVTDSLSILSNKQRQVVEMYYIKKCRKKRWQLL